MTPHDLLLRVLSGEASLESLPPEQQEKARRAFTSLRAAVAAPAFDAARLRESLRTLKPSSVEPTVFTAKSATLLGVPAILVKVFAVVLLSSIAAAAWHAFGTRTAPALRPSARQIAPDRWRIDSATVTATANGASMEDETVLLKHGSAQFANDGAAAVETDVLRALDGRVAFSVRGALRGAVRVIPQRNAVALSVYDSGDGALRTALRGASLNLDTLANSDALLLLNDAGEASVVRWDDITTPLPPVTQGEVLLRLRTGRIVHGVVAQQSREGILLHPTDAAGRLLNEEDDQETPELRFEESRLIWGDTITHQPESILAEEIAGWVPRQTPRGREVFARWLNEILPAQLREKSAEWRTLAEQHGPESTPNFTQLNLIPREWLLPEVSYSIKPSNEGPTLFAIPNAPDLGAGWFVDSAGQLHSMNATANTGRDF